MLKYLKQEPCLLIWDNFEPVNGFPEGEEDAGTRGGGDAGNELGNEPLLSLEEREQRRHLPFLGLFCERVNIILLHAFSSGKAGDVFGKAYRAVFGENLQKADWINLLNEAAQAGIVQYLGGTIYKLHPALPWFLRQRLNYAATRLGINSQANSESPLKRTEIAPDALSSPLERTYAMSLGFESQAVMDAQQKIAELEKKLLVFYTVLAENCRQQLINDAKLAAFKLQVEEANLLQNLRLAEQQQKWAEAQAILQPLGEIYKITGRKTEFKSLRLRLLKQIGVNLTDAKAKGKEAFNFWVYLRNQDANEAAQIGNFEEAQKIYQEIIDELIALNDPSVNNQIAILYTLLGNIAWEKQQFDNAIDYYQKALHIFAVTGDEYNAAIVYFQLGNVGAGQQSFDKASAYYQKSLHIFKAVGDDYKAASIYSNLGLVAHKQQKLEDAITFYQKAIEIYDAVGDEYGMASVYHNLGIIAEEQEQLEHAITFYHKSLEIKETSENYYRAASDYHNLGNLALEQEQFADAIAYYQKALQVYEAAGDEYNTTDVYLQLGQLAQIQQQFDEAIGYYKTAFKGYHKFQQLYKASITLIQWGNVLEAQEKWAEALQKYTHFLPIETEYAHELIDLRIRAWSGILNKLGESQFDILWRQITGEECTGELREAIWAARDELES
ncbi:MAG: tetratricopeptide repeat protein [Nostocaceae cyanobacterium]|nr:tetratricopeptide repeat protein [Nostocaceae cyanobacterium]